MTLIQQTRKRILFPFLLHPDSGLVADVVEDVACSDTSPVECDASSHVESSDESVQSLLRSTHKRRPKVYEGFQM